MDEISKTFIDKIFKYLYSKVFNIKNIQEDGSIKYSKTDETELLLFRECAKIKEVEIDYEREYQNVLLFYHFGSSPISDKSFWNLWNSQENKARGYILREAKTFIDDERNHLLKDLNKEDKWFKFIKRLKDLSKI